RPDLEVGICGEHGGDPDSIEWCHIIGNNYVSCSPFRVPIARLAAAHAALDHAVKPAPKAAAVKKPAAASSSKGKKVVKKVAKKAVKKTAKKK
ncbi:MAG: hypothetical protein LDL51_11190, partial [Chloroflexi bacterium]|nr:hypothetical protein [Chloroflexota bacterium]